MKEFLFNFFQIKKIIALLTTIVFSYLGIVGKISAEQFMTVFSMIIAFYFSQSSVRQATKEVQEQK